MNIINVTKTAWTKLYKIASNNKKYAFLFSASSGGCSGFNYELTTIEKNEFNDLIKPTILEYGDVKLAIDPLSEIYLIGTTIDYSENMFENKFTYIPDKDNATSCGCGISFNPK